MAECLYVEDVRSTADPVMQQALISPRAGQVTVTAGYNLECSHVIHTQCLNYDGRGED